MLFGGAALFLLVGVISASLYRARGQTHRDVRRFERVLHKKEILLREEFRQLEGRFSDRSPVAVLNEESDRYQAMAVRDGIAVFYYEGETLSYWSDHSIPVNSSWRQRLGRPFVPMRNADYVSVVRNTEEGILLGLILVRTHFPFQNEYLVNEYQGDFHLDPRVGIEFLEVNGTAPVSNSEGAYLFSLDFGEAGAMDRGLKSLSIACGVLFLVLLFMGMCTMVRQSAGRKRWIWISAVFSLLLSAGVAILVFSFPPILTGTTLFQPEIFASRLFPSLGHLLAFTVLVIALVILFYMYALPALRIEGFLRRLLPVILYMAAAMLMFFADYLIHVLVLDSTISFQAHNVTTFSVFTFVGLLVIFLWFALLVLVLDMAAGLQDFRMSRVIVTGGLTTGLTMAALLLLPEGNTPWVVIPGILLVLGGFLYLRQKHTGRIPFSRFIFLLLFFSLYMVARLQHVSRISLEREKEVELVKLSSEHDPVAEMLFSELSMAIRNDSILPLFLNGPYIEIDRILDRLRRNYLSGYWTRYDLQVTVCRPDDRVYIQPPDDEWRHCYTFFDEMILQHGIGIPGSDFYFLDNLNGRISYLASIPYFGASEEHRIFIELDSRILSEGLGYPELLLDVRYTNMTGSRFSYAKYNGGRLITQDGEYPYRRSAGFYTSGEEPIEKTTTGGYDHMVYNVDGQNTIIVGSPTVTPVDSLISFSYIFAFNFLLLGFIYLLTTVRLSRPAFNWTFKNRILYSMAGILFFTFLLICSGTVYFIVQQYRGEHNDNLRNTMRSVTVELIHKVEYEEDLMNWSSEDYYNLDELLRKFSNVFYTDINLYDAEGSLLATSRSEIFDRQLLSTRMNRLVFESLAREKASEYIHSEHIGGMRYISGYVPLLNRDNEFLAYLNLPYFTRSGELTKDVTNLVVAVINIYMILLLVVLVLSVILADRITQPLRMIQDRIAQVSLSQKNEKIRYERSDEIRGLVEEYNHMVEELERSAVLLAQSERESAWREMAKQIAHEIKNPLTPMKLNVQHLQRILENGGSDPELVRRISATLIEQIDSLSAIANEFSDFAKMPRARHEKINLVSKLQNLIQLFEGSERADIQLDTGSLSRVQVYADKEQLMRVFINMVKNGLQSIPEGRKGLIRIALRAEEDQRVTILFSDNGKGIPEEIRDRLFQPNFTTKSGGMGMGLAISYNIIRSLGGKIWYETEMDRGTTFFVQLPLMVEKR